ncbi:hypothetical protein E2C01_087159 [Portunus trituberculatus]|uniref:Uncharacterized protein n=1 Tax=Portunus trituberculatus TaxID=210409 RepID=A0A5B7JFF1_PORTR|nr:hypothetical protein [Portunus trituberculatus]
MLYRRTDTDTAGRPEAWLGIEPYFATLLASPLLLSALAEVTHRFLMCKECLSWPSQEQRRPHSQQTQRVSSLGLKCAYVPSPQVIYYNVFIITNYVIMM